MRPILILASLALIVGCVKNDTVFMTDREIVFDAPVLSVSTRSATKAAKEISNNFPTEGYFNVYAYFYNNGYTSVSDGSLYMENVPVSYDPSQGTNGGWKPELPYYWPRTGSLTFAAYYPTTGVGTVSYGPAGFVIENFEVAAKAEDQIDLLFSERAYDQTVSNQIDKNSHYYGVQLNFLHALSSIVFNVKADKTLVGDGSAEYEFKVKKIELLHVFDKGLRFDQNLSDYEHHSKTPEPTNSDWKIDVQSHKDFVAFEGELDVRSEVPVSTVSGSGKTNLILLPQPLDHGLDRVRLRVTYDLTHKDMQGYLENQVVEADMPTANVAGWLRGKRYIYTLTLGLAEIRLSPKVETWVNTDSPHISI